MDTCSHASAHFNLFNYATQFFPLFHLFLCHISWWLIHEQDCLSCVPAQIQIGLMFEGSQCREKITPLKYVKPKLMGLFWKCKSQKFVLLFSPPPLMMGCLLVSSRCRCQTAWSTSQWSALLWWMQQEPFLVNWPRCWELALAPSSPSLESHCLLSHGKGRLLTGAARVFFERQRLIQRTASIPDSFFQTLHPENWKTNFMPLPVSVYHLQSFHFTLALHHLDYR